jgi:hypothetical protein
MEEIEKLIQKSIDNFIEKISVKYNIDKLVLSEIWENKNISKITYRNSNTTEASERFYNNIKKLGGTVLGFYKNNKTHIKCLCKNGHNCNVVPYYITQGQGMCKICARRDPKEAEKQFLNVIKELQGVVLGEYTKCKIPVKCMCKNGHICYPFPDNVKRGQGMCSKCNSSGFEQLIQSDLEFMKYKYKEQVRHPLLPTLRYDFEFVTKDGQKFFIETHGRQHIKFFPFFHRKSEKEFLKCRERDLMKIMIAKQENHKLIILDHNFVKKSREDRVNYIQKCVLDDRVIICDSELYPWVYTDNPTEETIKKYIKN